MEPVNEHDPTMDSHLVHAVNVNNKKEVAEMKYLTKSLANARHVQENIYRQEEKDLIRQLWKLHVEKERRHPEQDYAGRSGHTLQRLSREQIEGSHSPRRGSHSVLYDAGWHHYHPHPPLTSHHQRGHDGTAHATHRDKGHDHQTASSHHAPAGYHRVSEHHISSSNTSSHHFDPALFVHHHRPEYYPVPHQAVRRHSTGGYQPPMDIPGVVSQSSRLNAVVQPAGYGHSITEHATHLGMHKHLYGGISFNDHHRPSHIRPPHNIDSYESLARYITLLDYQVNEERKAQKHKGKSHHQRIDKRQDADKEDKPRSDEVGDTQTTKSPPREMGGRTSSGTKHTKQGFTAVNDGEKADNLSDSAKKEVHGETALFDHHKQTTSEAASKTNGFVGVHSSTPSPTTEAGTLTLTDDQKATHPSQCRTRTENGNLPGFSHPTRMHTQSTEKITATKLKRTAHKSSNRKESTSAEFDSLKKKSKKGFTKKREKLGTRESHREIPHQHSSQYEHLSRHPSSYSSVHHPHHITRQILADIQAVPTHSSHHSRTYHPHHQAAPDHINHRHARHEAPITAAERKRLAIELLAREYPVLLRHAPTKFDPLDALMCRYLRLSSTNVETLEEMCKEAGIEVGAHAHHQIDNVNEYVFGSGK